MKKLLIGSVVAFLIPFLLTAALLVNHEKEQAYEEIQRTHTTLGQETAQPDDEKKAWKGAIDASLLFATPMGLIGVGIFGCFLVGKKLLGREKKR